MDCLGVGVGVENMDGLGTCESPAAVESDLSHISGLTQDLDWRFPSITWDAQAQSESLGPHHSGEGGKSIRDLGL